MRITSRAVVFIVLSAAAFTVAVGQITKDKSTKPFPSIKKLMATAEFTKAGLTKLSDDEIQELDRWLQVYTLEVANAVLAQAAAAQEGRS